MAVDSKPGETNGASGAASDAAAALARRRKSSSLMQAASSLPTVEHSLEEFIAKANQTLVDVNTWTQAETAAREEDERRKEQDAQRWKQAEAQMRDSDAREQALHRQLDGLQGKLAEAEARAAVAMSASATTANDAMIGELKHQIDAITERMQSAEQQSERLSIDLTAAQNELRMSRAMPAVSVPVDHDTAAERVRLAEAKAAKALAAARAAAAGLTVSSADLAAIESGLVVVEPPRRASPPVVPIALAFVGGIAIMFAVWKLALTSTDQPAPAASPPAQPAQQAQPAVATPAPPLVTTPPPITTPPVTTPPVTTPAVATPAVATPPPAHPTVTPIDDQAAAAPAAPAAPTPAAKSGPTVTPIEEPPAAPPAAAVEVPATPKPATRPARKVSKPASGTTEKKPEPKDKADKKPPGGIVDPF